MPKPININLIFILFFVRIYSSLKKIDWFYFFLKLYVKDIQSAKNFYKKFWREWDEYIPFIGFISLRSMCYHLSMVLEGYNTNPCSKKIFTDYFSTKYGSEIYANTD